jgi:RimJ/RimL family protein N-acetyltransferase
MGASLHPELVAIRDLSDEDIPFVLDYWFRSPSGYLEAMGVDPAKLPSEAQMKSALADKIRRNRELADSKLNALAILYDGRFVGFHTLFPVTEGDSGIFHAHVCQPAMRGRGLASRSYPLACLAFIGRFGLQRILFKTPTQNTGAIRVKEKLGIRRVGQERVGFGIIRDETQAEVFELTRDEAERLAQSG